MISKREKKKIQSLQKKKGRKQWNLFIGEGFRWIQTAIELGHKPIRLYMAESFLCPPSLKVLLEKEHLNSQILSDKEFREVSTTQNPQGILGLFPITYKNMTEYPRIEELSFPLIGLNQIQDPGNLGTLIRTAFSFGYPTILLDPLTADPFQPKAARASLGTLFGINLIFSANLLEDIRALLNQGGHLYLTDPKKGRPVHQIQPNGFPILLFGNEGQGIEKSFFSLSHTPVNIPMKENAESLNITVSAGIILYHFAQKIQMIS